MPAMNKAFRIWSTSVLRRHNFHYHKTAGLGGPARAPALLRHGKPQPILQAFALPLGAASVLFTQ
jgi:hypothetical protein